MKLSESYLKAARLIDSGKHLYCCTAIMSAGAFVTDFEDRFRPKRLPKDHNEQGWYGYPEETAQSERILALCFMAAICESEGN
jgi:hypothetical protein